MVTNLEPPRRRSRLTEEEWVVLLDYFFQSPEPTHTDSHPLCHQLAQLLGRTPGSVDSSLRNIKSIHTGAAGFTHASKLARDVYESHATDLATLHLRAEGIREQLELRGRGLAPGLRQEALNRLREFNREHRDQPAAAISRDTTIFHRPGSARTDLLTLTGTTCQICGVPGFPTRSSSRYTEVHHLDELARRTAGNLCSDNVIVVCPTCHAKLHHANVTVEDLLDGQIRITINGTVYSVQRNLESRLEDLLMQQGTSS